MSDSQASIEVFCSYADKDEPLFRQLEVHLSLLKRQGLISIWHHRLVVPGTNWAQMISTQLERASVILLLISPDFLASDYCYGIEMKRALERSQTNEARVIPIILRPTADWRDTPLGHLAVLPTTTQPITTWRYRDEAFADIAAGIRRAIEDLHHIAVSTQAASFPQVWNIPYPRNPFFIGRKELLSQLSTELRAGQAMALSQPQAISGLGGVGKTQIAIEYAYQHRGDYQVVLWVRAESRETLTSSFLTIAHLLNLPQKEERNRETIIEAVKTWLQTHKGWLLILDNADDLAVLDAFLPPAFEGHLLLTTRAQAMGRLAHKIEVDTFTSEVGALFLLHRASLLAPDATLEQARTTDRESALKITQELGGLPLALDQAGAYLEETGCSLVDYLQMYQQHRRDLLRERRGQVSDHPEPVATTWSLSFTRAEQVSPAAADLLRLCALLEPDAIPEEIIATGTKRLGSHLSSVAADPFLLNQAIEALRAYSLIKRDTMTHTFSMHRLVQAVIQDAMKPETLRLWAERAVSAISEVFPNAELDANLVGGFVRVRPGGDEPYRRYLPHALKCATWIEEENLALPASMQLLKQVTLYYARQGDYRPAEPVADLAARICAQLQGPDHPTTQQLAENYLAVQFMIQANTDLPIEFFPSLLEATIKVAQEELKQQKRQVETLFSHFLLAAIHFKEIERLEMAIKYCEIAVKIAPRGSLEELAPHLLLVQIYDKLNNADKSLKELGEAAKIDKKNPGIYYLMAEVYAWKRDYEGTIRELENAVKLGFNDIDAVVKEPNFEPFLSDPKMKMIIKKMKRN